MTCYLTKSSTSGWKAGLSDSKCRHGKHVGKCDECLAIEKEYQDLNYQKEKEWQELKEKSWESLIKMRKEERRKAADYNFLQPVGMSKTGISARIKAARPPPEPSIKGKNMSTCGVCFSTMYSNQELVIADKLKRTFHRQCCIPCGHDSEHFIGQFYWECVNCNRKVCNVCAITMCPNETIKKSERWIPKSSRARSEKDSLQGLSKEELKDFMQLAHPSIWCREHDHANCKEITIVKEQKIISKCTCECHNQ